MPAPGSCPLLEHNDSDRARTRTLHEPHQVQPWRQAPARAEIRDMAPRAQRPERPRSPFAHVPFGKAWHKQYTVPRFLNSNLLATPFAVSLLNVNALALDARQTAAIADHAPICLTAVLDGNRGPTANADPPRLILDISSATWHLRPPLIDHVLASIGHDSLIPWPPSAWGTNSLSAQPRTEPKKATSALCRGPVEWCRERRIRGSRLESRCSRAAPLLEPLG